MLPVTTAALKKQVNKTMQEWCYWKRANN